MADIKHFDPDTVLDTVVLLFWQRGTADTGIRDVVAATGLSRSSLYATFGGKRELHLAALERYAEHRSRPPLDRLAADDRGLPAVEEFFTRLVETRCTGAQAGWGCLVSNTHTAPGPADPAVRALLDRQHERLRTALHTALRTARQRRQLAPDTDPDAAAELLALLTHGINLRSRAGADPARLRAVATTALDALTPRPA
ncbi:TetR/AcrR family transcriptional regulator [Kitasatospora sp. NPDC088134]|uniref:TetR/AcrR family transcriptional regulator n=1 Tax=Kitasatospora sp. NPDC088134 TaxID=3364071 RepID=UPI00381A1B72